jgi:hypothetical protein
MTLVAEDDALLLYQVAHLDVVVDMPSPDFIGGPLRGGRRRMSGRHRGADDK